ncbi:MAG: protein translocase subunit SecD [Deltaproteobacteria bacterium]|nr:protein translocase subunit SecD [Deltaproteobacteria bacterium]
MDRAWWAKVLMIVGITAIATWYLIPTFFYFKLPADVRNDTEVLQKALPSWAPSAKHKLNLGLDLQGGIHLVMRVDVDKALRTKTETRTEQIKSTLKDKNIAGAEAKALPDDLRVQLTFNNADSAKSAEKIISDYYQDMHVASGTDTTVLLAFNDQDIKRAKTDAVDQAVKTIRNRVDQFGVAEPEISKRGSDSISIELPGLKDPERVKDLIGQTAQLQFKIVDDDNTEAQNLFSDVQLPPGVTLCARSNHCANAENVPFLQGPDRKVLKELTQGKAPEGDEIALEKQESPGQAPTYRTYLLKSKTEATGENLIDAHAALDQTGGGRPYVSFEWNPLGAQDFERLTENNIRHRMAIILDDQVMSAPVIQSKISAHGQITLGSNKDYNALLAEAQDLSLVLKSGALPAPVTIGEERTVGASLGEELISRGWKSCALGILLVVIFMALYYKLTGVIADLALVLNALLVLAVMALFNSTLSLPGIAGFVLTLGIAVDANVLINERIREETRAGRTPRGAVEQGYGRAFWTIFDAHVTSLIAGFVLRQYGTGPVRGFATTLIIGILASLFTSIVVTRVCVDYLLKNVFAKKISV